MNSVNAVIAIGLFAITVFTSDKRLKKAMIKLLALFTFVNITKFNGHTLGKVFYSKIVNNVGRFFKSDFAAKLDERISTFFGTVTVFLCLFATLRLLGKLDNGDFNTDLRSVVVDRLRGALVGLFAGIGFVFSFTEVVNLSVTAANLEKRATPKYSTVDASQMYKFVGNLN
jgi:hypothetical protein